jgi:hypothetical protein
MNVDGTEIGGSVAVVARSSGAGRTTFDRLAVGQEITLTVLRRLGAGEYLVAIGSERHVVESAVDLAVGAQVRAGVTAVDERLTLRYIEAEKPRADDEPQEGDLIGQLAARHGVTPGERTRAAAPRRQRNGSRAAYPRRSVPKARVPARAAGAPHTADAGAAAARRCASVAADAGQQRARTLTAGAARAPRRRRVDAAGAVSTRSAGAAGLRPRRA